MAKMKPSHHMDADFAFRAGKIVCAALKKSGADMTLVFNKGGHPDKTIFQNVSGQYAETVTKAKRQKK